MREGKREFIYCLSDHAATAVELIAILFKIKLNHIQNIVKG